MKKFLDLAGLIALWGKIKNWVTNYVGVGVLYIKTKEGSNAASPIIDFSANLGDAKTLTVENGTNITLSGSSSNTIKIAHTTSGAGALSTAALKKLTWDAQGHITGSSAITNSDLQIPVNNAAYDVYVKKTGENGDGTKVSGFTANASDPDKLVFVEGSNIVLARDATNKTITISAAGSAAPGEGKLSISTTLGGSGTLLTHMNLGNDKTLTLIGGNNLNTSISTNTDEVVVTIDHDVMTSAASPLSPTAATATNYVAGNDLLSGFTLTHTNGHITAITPTYKKINIATESNAGLMSIEDKKTLNLINQTIANALTSAITPKGGITPYELLLAVSALETILSAAHVGDLYRLIDEDDTTDPNYGKPLAIGNTQSNDIVITYSTFMEGSSLTNNGTERHEFPAGTYVMVVNTGTAQSPVYKLDAVSGLYDMSNYWGVNDLKAIPVNTSDDDYEAGDETIDSICV